MPQIVLYTYLSQTTWTILLFFIFYYIMKQYFLPLIYENIKLKSLLLHSTSDSKSSKKTGVSYTFSKYYNNSFYSSQS